MKRLNYIDGLKGWCAVSICLLHFQLMFVINGYIGWRCLPEAALNPFDYYFQWFPYSIFSNNPFPLYIFFALISFLVSYTFMKHKNEDKLKEKIVMRYFRFLPLVSISCFVAYLLLTFNLCPLQEFYDITGNTWGYARLEETYTFLDMLKIGFFTSFFKGTQLVSPLWCLHYIFLGSILSSLLTLLYTKVNNKIFFFGFAITLFYFADQNYLAFIVGLIAGIIAHNEYSMSKIKGAMLVIVGCVLGLFPSVLLPSFINVTTLYALGAGFIIVGIHCCFSDHRLLSNKFAEFLGRESLALIIWQMLVLQSLNIFLYNYFHGIGMRNPTNIAINLAVNMGISLLLTWVSSKTITPLTDYLCEQISDLLGIHTETEVPECSLEKTIPYPKKYGNAPSLSGASSFRGATNHVQSRYYVANDFFHMKSDETLHILNQFQTYQQTMEHTCGAASALMVLNWFGQRQYHKKAVAALSETHLTKGSSVENIADLFNLLGWNVDWHASTNLRFQTVEDAEKLIIDYIDRGIPIMVDWVDWGGHWEVLIGIDTCGTDTPYDDVLIFADPYDITDHNQDGYYTYPLGRFFSMWREGPCAEKAEPYLQPFVAAWPKQTQEIQIQ